MNTLYDAFAIIITLIVSVGVAFALIKAFIGIFFQVKAKVKHPRKVKK